ncbi:MAG: N-acetylmuramoyl-L-alanine amidase, partial [Anaerolineales bacterium]|nr:N-acetylmuramoyl-L-alanine amidase [Anaerolineales bacterium]
MNLIDMRTSPPRHLWKTWDRRTLPATHVVVHHSATSYNTSIYEIAFYHVNNKDMPSIQYHYVVTADGQVCWMNDDELLVWHGHGSNEWGIGVCLVGDFTHEHPPEVQLRAARELVAHLEARHGRRLEVIGHKEAPRAATACPGDTWDEWKGELRMTEGGGARILLQTQSPNYPDWLVDHARRLGGCQLINPWRGAWWKFRDAGVPFVLGRYVAPNDADNALVAQGARGAEIWFRDWFWPNASRCPGITKWSGHNEKPAFNAEQARAQDAFVSRLADLYHDHGLQLVAYRVSTHHWEYGLWQYFGESLAKVDYLARNSYAYGDRFDLHDADGLMRLVKDVEAIRRYGHRVPPCILTEIGYDSDPSPGIGHRGWRTRGIDAETYTTELIHALLRLSSAVP